MTDGDFFDYPCSNPCTCGSGRINYSHKTCEDEIFLIGIFILVFVTAGIAALITVLDYVVPSLSTKKFGGSKAGIWGCNIGLVISIVGLPFGPQGLLGVILWPFIGAFVGEMISGKASREALRAAWGAFVGFLTGTGLKFVYSIILLIIVIRDIIVS